MNRKTCNQSKNDNPNWLEKTTLPELNRIEYNFTECFLDGSLKAMKFSDKQMLGDGKILGYSCEGLIV